ncbi:MAG: dTDP-4-dehydrorhamnose reductase [Acidobacteriota bacterium]
MRIAVTGAAGLLGSSLSRLLRGRHDCWPLSHSDLDVTDGDAVCQGLSELEPEAVLHCAAYTHVDGAERDEARAMEVNAKGAEYVARAARRVGALMVYVSTDYVFDGEKAAPYREEDPPRPRSRYGLSKLEGERRVAEVNPADHLIVRTAWLYGSGKGFVDWLCRRLDVGEPVRLVADQVGSPTWAPDLAEALLCLVENGQRGIFHFVNKGETSWLDFGRAVAELTGHPEARIEAVAATDLGRPAPRPDYSVLAVEKFEKATGRSVPSWRDALGRCLGSRAA